MPKTTSNIRGTRTISKIVDAAAKLFGKEGYQGASMNSVAAAAGVSKGLLHYHFRSKEHLLIEAQRATFKQVHLRFEKRYELGERGIEHALYGLDALWDAVVDMRAWAPFMVETWSLAGDNDAVREHLDSFYEESMQLLQKGIENAFEGQEEQLALPPERLAKAIRIALQGLVVSLAFVRTDEELEDTQQSYKDMRDFFASSALKPEASS